MRIKGKAVIQALAIGMGFLPLGFVVGYYAVFVGLKTPAGVADGQAGLAEFLRIMYSIVLAAISAIIAIGIAMWRLWPRTTN